MKTAPAATIEVCFNIGPRQRAFRLRFGVLMAAIAAALFGVLLGFEAPRVTRIAVFMPVVLACLGVFQAREKT